MPEEKNLSLIDLTHLTKPLEKLIDAVASAVGVLYEPRRIKKKAEAEAEAAIIHAKSRGKVSEIEQRIAQRIYDQETRRQKNIEAITFEAHKSLPSTVSDTPVDPDWINSFFENCKDVSNEDMRILWGKVLAGEVSQPTSFSRRTLSVLRDCSRDDAEHLTKVATATWLLNNEPIPLILSKEADFLERFGLTYPILQHMDSAGLIIFQPASKFISAFPYQEIMAEYFDERYRIIFPERAKKEIDVGFVYLTVAGAELRKVTKAIPDNSFRDEIITYFSRNVTVIKV